MSDRSSVTVEVPADTPVADVEQAMSAALAKLPSGSRVVMGRGGAQPARKGRAAGTQEPPPCHASGTPDNDGGGR